MTKKRPPIRYKNDVDYSRQRFRKTMVTNKALDNLFYVEECVTNRDGQTVLCTKDVRNRETTELSFDDILLEHPRLGMTLYYNRTLYLLRFPYRQYRQGLCWDNVQWRTLPCDQDSPRFHDNSFDSLSIFYTPCVDEYPDIWEVKDMLDSGYVAVPLNKDVAVNKSGDVFFRSFKEPVGKFDFESKTIKVTPNYSFITVNPTVSKFTESNQ